MSLEMTLKDGRGRGGFFTFGAVLSGPSAEADLVAVLAARVVPELVVAGPAEIGAPVAVVVFVAFDPVLVIQRLLLTQHRVAVVLPHVGRFHPALRCQLHYHHFA